jgi:plasmid stabilization system protein ParE
VTLPVVFRDVASEDVHEAQAWYEAQQQGLGVRFRQSLSLLVSLISEHPLACPAVHRKVHRALLPGFPYALFYLVQPERVLVLACLHQHRGPRALRQRVQPKQGG